MDFRFLIRHVLTKIYWFFANPLRRWYRYVVRPKNGRATKVMILCNEKLLLTRPNYGHRLWTVPGGAVEKNETYEDGARREIMEELGIEIAELTMRGGYEMIFDYKEFTVKTFIAHVKTEACVIDRIEVKEAHWFQLSELPWDRTPRVDELIRLI